MRGRGFGAGPRRASAAAAAAGQAADLGRLERPDGAAAQAVDADRADADADEPLDRRPDRAEHPPELALPALRERRPVPVRAAAAAGRSSATSRSVSNALIARRPDSSARPSSSVMPALQGRRPGRASSGVPQPERVLALDAEARVEDPLGPVAVVGEQEHALGVLVEAADRVEPRALGHEGGRQQVEHGPVRRGGRGWSR